MSRFNSSGRTSHNGPAYSTPPTSTLDDDALGTPVLSAHLGVHVVLAGMGPGGKPPLAIPERAAADIAPRGLAVALLDLRQHQARLLGDLDVGSDLGRPGGRRHPRGRGDEMEQTEDRKGDR